MQRVRAASPPGRPVAVIFEDGPWNDFGALLQLDARTTFGADVYPLVSSINFFRVSVPLVSVHVAVSCAAMHYLSGPPPVLIAEGGLHHTDASPDEQRAFSAQAAADWETLLLARAAELVPGGRLVISNFAIDERSGGWFLGSTDYGSSVYTELSGCLRSGRLTAEEFALATSPEYYRTLREHVAPFDDPASPVRRAGLTLVSAEMRNERCALRRRFVDGGFESAEAYGRAVASTVGAFTRSKVRRAFDRSTRTADDQAALIDEVYDCFARKVAARPLAFGIDNVMAHLVIAKAAAAGGAIKSMQLYAGVERIYNNPGIGRDGSALTVAQLAPHDQLHYHGTDAVDAAIVAARIQRQSRVLEAGAGYGGPARHIANATGAHVTAVELQHDLHAVGAELTRRCGLEGRVAHVCGDLLTLARRAAYDAVVSWLAWYHIGDKPTLLANMAGALAPGGRLYVEDIYALAPLETARERHLLENELYGRELPTRAYYVDALAAAGFVDVSFEDVTPDWRRLTVARAAKYLSERDAHVAVHGEATVAGLAAFYSAVAELFAGGRMGGVRIVATRGGGEEDLASVD